MRRRSELIVALDFPKTSRAMDLVERLGGAQRFWKVGLELFSRGGSDVVEQLLDRGHRVFLDLKLHDIPNTVAAAARVASRLGVDLLTVHASGGSRMLAAAREGVEGSRTRVLAVTVLTSLSAEELSVSWGRAGVDPEVEVGRLAALAMAAGAHGVVASPAEVRELRARLGPDALVVTPGIRMAGDGAQDQFRISGPAEAVEAGADFLVVGRPISRAVDPRTAFERYSMAMESVNVTEMETT